MNYFTQGAGEEIRWTFDFSDLLLAGDSIVGVPVVTISEGTVANIAPSSPNVSVDVSGVPFGRVVRLLCTVSTANGETISNEAAIRGGER